MTADAVDGSDFSFRVSVQFTVGSQHFGYTGSCRLQQYEGTKTVDGRRVATTVYQFNILNSLPVVRFTAQKEWEDENNRDRLRPSGLPFTLTRTENDPHHVWSDVEQTAVSSGWNVDFGNYPMYGYDNTPYTYQVSENLPDGSDYVLQSSTESQEGILTHYTFTNRLSVSERSLTVEKYWNDADYRNTVRPTDLTKISVALWCRYLDSDGVTWIDHPLSDSVDASVSGIRAHIASQTASYQYAPTLRDFTVTDDDHQSYTFEYLPVFINVDGGAREEGTPEKWQAVTYYVRESFAVNGHVYRTDYSSDNTVFSNTPSYITGTKLLRDENQPRAAVTAGGSVYPAADDGMLTVPTGSLTGSFTGTIDHLPARDGENHAYLYSVKEYDALGNVITSGTLQAVASGSDPVTLQVTKPLSEGEDRVRFKIFRRVGGGTEETVYLMEPYAYADSSYHIQYTSPKAGWGADYAERYFSDEKEYFGNLTYEITIPQGAAYFRINNGTVNTVGGIYSGYGSYKTAITRLAEDATRKNHNNYWKLAPSGSGTSYGYSASRNNVELVHWSDADIRKADSHYWDTSSAFPVESDSDFIYFKKPSGWKNHVYAYFYAGGDVRKNNYQRAVYSIWPGVVPYGSEVTAPSSSGGYDDFADGIGQMTLVPGSTFRDASGNTFYRFRLPLGDRTNYDCVLFSDGMMGSGSGEQTGYYHGEGSGHESSKTVRIIPGYAYDQYGSSWQLADSTGATQPYQLRKNDNSDAAAVGLDDADYLYIRNNNAGLWDNLHITFYDAGGGSVFRTGTGYVMEYAGTQDGYQYFRIPIPVNAARFSVNNGSNQASGKVTGLYPLLRHDNENTAATATGTQVYEIVSSTALKLVSPEENITVHTTITEGTEARSEGIDYTIRTHSEGNDTVSDCVWIENTADWTESDFYDIHFRFYDAGGQRIASDTKEYPAFKRADRNLHHWICKEIPVKAASFSITKGNTVRRYDIYLQAASGSAKSFTGGDMIYQTRSDGTLTLAWPTAGDYQNRAGSDTANDDFGENTRGDFLYLVDTANGSSWDELYVVFYQEDGITEICNESDETHIGAVPLGTLSRTSETVDSGVTTSVPEAAGSWYRINIPKNAASFRLYHGDGDTPIRLIPSIRSREAIPPVKRTIPLVTWSTVFRLPEAEVPML